MKESRGIHRNKENARHCQKSIRVYSRVDSDVTKILKPSEKEFLETMLMAEVKTFI